MSWKHCLKIESCCHWRGCKLFKKGRIWLQIQKFNCNLKNKSRHVFTRKRPSTKKFVHQTVLHRKVLHRKVCALKKLCSKKTMHRNVRTPKCPAPKRPIPKCPDPVRLNSTTGSFGLISRWHERDFDKLNCYTSVRSGIQIFSFNILRIKYTNYIQLLGFAMYSRSLAISEKTKCYL